MLVRILHLAAGVIFAGIALRAEKKLSVKVTHAPILGDALSGRALVRGQITGECSKEFGDLLLDDLRAYGLPLPSSGDGMPTVTLSVTVERCEGRPLPAMLGEGLPAVHIARTEGWFAARVRVADSAGQEVASAIIHGHAQKENQSQTSAPEWPAPAELKQLALRQALADARRLYAKWTEDRDVPFMDNKECNLKEEYETARSGDYAALLRIARPTAESCKTKASMEAWYNLGVALWLAHRYSEAAAAFQKCVDLKGTKLAGSLLEESRKEAAAAQASQPKPVPADTPPAQTGIVLTNDFIIKLTSANVDEAEILKMIANQPGHFSFDAADLNRLGAAGVSPAVIAAMRAKR